jgi:hypothetical protein
MECEKFEPDDVVIVFSIESLRSFLEIAYDSYCSGVKHEMSLFVVVQVIATVISSIPITL